MENRSESDSFEQKSQVGQRPRPAKREIKFRHSTQFVPILEHLQCSLLVSTYAAGKVVSVGAAEGRLHLGFSNFQQAMGIACGAADSGAADRLAIGGPNVIWLLRDAGELAAKIQPVGVYDGGYLARESFVTGNIHVHEMGWGNEGQLWVVNTLFSCLSTLHEDFNFVPRWRPPFITELSPQDRCHLNGLAMESGRPKLVTALGTSNSARGWRERKQSGGVLMEVESGEVVAEGFCMPHSPRLRDGAAFVLDSGRGRLVRVALNDGTIDEVAAYPGYGRGLALHGQFAFVGMSRARETSVFGGVPICEKPEEMRCGIVVIDLIAGRSVAYLEFESGVEELFDVQVIPGRRRTVICGPYPVEDEQLPVWVVPPEDRLGSLVAGGDGGFVSRKPRH
ncbi:TIGR03032 family protein [Roseiconus nitratireducens]|uniref:TIGR03032 family protein n=1 Tax=Roseiconus nitratireducens TaxID=2605748 RepID=A0A5M6DCZ1_9BACT|nr:TIGR03032 family protein [Roseiconus nitratireducens]KAA5544336.1 TIGR03032 family protein [Roseiconus nitratireducens]